MNPNTNNSDNQQPTQPINPVAPIQPASQQPILHQPELNQLEASEPKKHSIKKIVIFVILVIVGLLSVLGWMVYKNNKKVPATSTSTPVAPITKSTTSTSTTDQYTGWKTFKWSYEGLSIKYPANWTFENPDGSPNPDYANEPIVYIKSNNSQSIKGSISSVNNGAVDTYKGAFDIELSVSKPADNQCNVSDNSKSGDPSLSDYIVNVIPFKIPNYKDMNFIEDGGNNTSTVSELALTDQPVKLGITTSPYLQDIYSSKNHPGEYACITSGFFGGLASENPPSYITYVTLNKNTFENLPDYKTAILILKSLSY